MATVTVFTSLTLDGVMQARGRPDEDTRDGLAHGGWAVPYMDEVMGRSAARGMGGSGSLLLGRRTYEDFHWCWGRATGCSPRACTPPCGWSTP
jgi:dihydrofolate reductase